MYVRPLDLTASCSSWACSTEPKTAGTALATCLPCLSTSMQCLTWLGASVATKTASIASSLTNSSSEGYVLSQRQALASAAQRSGNRSLTATTATLGWSWKPNAAPNWQTPWPTIPTRIFRSETGCQAFLGRSDVLTPPAPRISAPGCWASAVVSRRSAAIAPSEPRPSMLRNDRRVSGLFITGSSGVVGGTGAAATVARLTPVQCDG